MTSALALELAIDRDTKHMARDSLSTILLRRHWDGWVAGIAIIAGAFREAKCKTRFYGLKG